MSGLAHFIEQRGIPTVTVSLIRQHTERMRPPRALAVPFELGRPFGAPGEPDFQRRVLLEALKLLERTDGPFIADFPDAPPGPPADMEGWACPVNLAAPKGDLSDEEKFSAALKQEIALLKPWYEEGLKRGRGRRLGGLTDFTPEDIVDYHCRYLDDPGIESPIEGETAARAVKLCADDLKHFYYQAALARPGAADDVTLANWFYGETLAGRLFLKLRETMMAQDDPVVQRLGRVQLVPMHQAFRSAQD